MKLNAEDILRANRALIAESAKMGTSTPYTSPKHLQDVLTFYRHWKAKNFSTNFVLNPVKWCQSGKAQTLRQKMLNATRKLLENPRVLGTWTDEAEIFEFETRMSCTSFRVIQDMNLVQPFPYVEKFEDVFEMLEDKPAPEQKEDVRASFIAWFLDPEARDKFYRDGLDLSDEDLEFFTAKSHEHADVLACSFQRNKLVALKT